MSEIFPRFIDALQQANLDVTGREVAEILWLALQMSPTTEEVAAAPEQDGNSLQSSDELLAADTTPPAQTPKSSSAKTEATSDVHLHSQKSSSKSKGYQGAILARIP